MITALPLMPQVGPFSMIKWARFRLTKTLMVLTGVLLLRRRPLGYLLASAALIKFVTMGIALIAMIVGELLAGVAVSAVEAVIFVLMVSASLAMASLLWRNVSEARLA